MKVNANSITASIVVYVFLVLGILQLIGAFWFYQNTQTFLKEATATEGSVVELVRRQASRSRPGRNVSPSRAFVYAPKVEFKDYSGQVVTFTSNAASNPPRYSVGDTLEVLYEVDAPEKARIHSFFSLWGVSLIFFVMGLSFSLISSLFIVLSQRF